MSSTSSETETYEITLSRDEAWVVHHVLTTRIDDALATDGALSGWTLDLLESVESGGQTATLTATQARNLCDALARYVDGDAPEEDVVHGSTVIGRLEDRLGPPI